MQNQLNKVELVGTVGRTLVQKNEDRTILRFTLATALVIKENDEDCIIETTWHNIAVYDQEIMPSIESIKAGANVHVVGRTRNIHYRDQKNSMQEINEVVTRSIEVLSENAAIERY